ncbi:hypothetical protein WDZ92_24905 [Nostoc sp. NIES-2111]
MTASFTWWHKALEGSFGPIHENDPQPGFYRTRPRKGESGDPVAIFETPEGLKALRAGRLVDPCDVWTWCCMQPITRETYIAVAERGEPWPDQNPARAGIGHNSGRTRQTGDQAEIVVLPPHGPAWPEDPGETGHPSGPGCINPEGPGGSLAHTFFDLHGLEAAAASVPILPQTLEQRLVRLEEQADALLENGGLPATQTAADLVANYATLFGMLETVAETRRTTEKRPVLEQGRAIDRAWKGVLARAGEAKTRMKRAVETFLVSRFEALQEEIGFGPVPETQMPRAGTLGRRIGLRLTRCVSVIDRTALIGGYRDDARLWAREGVEKALLDLAETDPSGGKPVPGALLIEKRVAV